MPENSREEWRACDVCVTWKEVSKFLKVSLENGKELEICEDCFSKSHDDDKIFGKEIKKIGDVEPLLSGELRELLEWEKGNWGSDRFDQG